MVELMLRQEVEWPFFSSDDDRCYGGDFDAENHLGKAEESKFFDECINNWDADEWKRNFCVSRATFQFLCLELTPYLQRSSVV